MRSWSKDKVVCFSIWAKKKASGTFRECQGTMWSVILEYLFAVLIVGVFVVLPWLLFLSIGGQYKAVTLMSSLNYASWWLMSVRMTRYVIHDLLE